MQTLRKETSFFSGQFENVRKDLETLASKIIETDQIRDHQIRELKGQFENLE